MADHIHNSKKILLVEDDRISRESLAYLLRGLGHQVREVWSAEDGKSALTVFEPEVALLDVRLPGLPGDAFAVYLKRKCPATKIIFISGEFQLDDTDTFGAGAEFLTKPLDFNKLLEAINR